MGKADEAFDAGYYGRYYKNSRTRVHGAKEIAKLCTAVTSMLDWWHVPIETVLDVGAGVGLWRDWFAKHRPKTSYRSTEVSRYACAQYGHEQRDITAGVQPRPSTSSFARVCCRTSTTRAAPGR